MWTTEQLQAFFERNGIPSNSYAFYSEEDEAICIDKVGSEWRVYYSERGSKNELGWGKSESQALDIMKLFVLEASGRLPPNKTMEPTR